MAITTSRKCNIIRVSAARIIFGRPRDVPVSLAYVLDRREVHKDVKEHQNSSSRAFSFSFSDLLWRCLYFGFAQLLFEGAYVCTNVCHSEDEVLLFGKHFGLSITTTYIRTSLLSFWLFGWDKVVWCLPVTFVCAGRVVLRSKRYLWTATSSCPNCP